jgi:hypothetical protein
MVRRDKKRSGGVRTLSVYCLQLWGSGQREWKRVGVKSSGSVGRTYWKLDGGYSELEKVSWSARKKKERRYVE